MSRPEPEARAPRGHRALPHTADVILEAWGPDRVACCEEAVAALASVYVDAARAELVERRRVHLAPGPTDAVLLDLLEEVIFALDTADGVPVGAEVHTAPDGGLDAELLLADRATVTATGAVPKAVSRSELAVGRQGGRFRCRFLIDV
jgi:SHS2 domain-containing protein